MAKKRKRRATKKKKTTTKKKKQSMDWVITGIVLGFSSSFKLRSFRFI